MTTEEIKQAINQGQTVYWANKAYRVIKDSLGQYLIRCDLNGNCIGLTNQAGDRLNGEEKEFFTLD